MAVMAGIEFLVGLTASHKIEHDVLHAACYVRHLSEVKIQDIPVLVNIAHKFL